MKKNPKNPKNPKKITKNPKKIIKNPKITKNPKKITKKILKKKNLYGNYIPNFYEKNREDKIFKPDSRPISWGLGLEHEMQLFHQSKKNNIIFDSQESTCFLLNESIKSGVCCKTKKICYNKDPNSKKYYKKTINLSDEEKKFLRNIPWELSGRQQKGCEPDPIILKRVPVLMPEFITGNHKNRTIESLSQELINQEKKFIEIQMKNPHTKEKVKKYGKLVQTTIGSMNNIEVPLSPTIGNNNYTISPENNLDYLGSFHITITLPCHSNISNDEFVNLHRNFGKQIQMIEPLLISSFFSGDPRAVGDYGDKVEGSFRVMVTGWGNFAGTNLSKLGKGIGRYANIESYWRNGMDVKDANKLMKCNKEVYIDEPNSIGILGSDFRTFGFNYTKSCPGKECPKVSGDKMVYPNGIELRIFDHFDSKYIIELLRILSYLAENSRIKECKQYIYNNKSWKKTMRDIMMEGWNAKIGKDYIELLRKNLGINMKVTDMKAYNVFKVLSNDLFQKNKNGLYCNLMIKKEYTNPPILPKINRLSWEKTFNKNYKKEIKDFIILNLNKNKKYSIKYFKNLFFKTYNIKKWSEDIEDILYFFNSKPNKILNLEIKNSNIIALKRGLI